MTSVLYPQHQEGQFTDRRQVAYAYDSMARLNSVQTKLGTVNDQTPSWQSVVSGVSFNAFGSLTGLTQLGTSEARTYNILGQMTRMTKGSSIDVEYRFSSTANDGKIVSQKNWQTGEDVTYAYDELERMISAATTNNASWGLNFAYDGFGNRLSQSVSQGSGPVSSLLVDGNTNRISSSGFSYDSNGNMTQMPKGGGSMNLSYDLSNRMTNAMDSGFAEDYRYAPDNRRIWRNQGKVSCQDVNNSGVQGLNIESPGEQVIFYSPGGQKMGVYCMGWSSDRSQLAITASEENVYFGARLVAKRLIQTTQLWTGLVSDFTTDRLQSKGNGSSYYPYGESRGGGGDDREQFATYTRDAGTGLDYADQRWYASGLGRFTSADAYWNSKLSGAPANWNKFNYVRQDPANLTDRFGLVTDGDDCDWDSSTNSLVCSALSREFQSQSTSRRIELKNTIVKVGSVTISHIVNDPNNTNVKRVNKILDWLKLNLDSEREQYLSSGVARQAVIGITAGLYKTVADYLTDLQNIEGVGVATITSTSGSIVNAVAYSELPLIVNDGGSVLGRGAGTSQGILFAAQIAGMPSSSLQRGVFTLLHELGHLLNDFGFEKDLDDSSAGARNDDRIWATCNKTIAAAK